MKTTEHPSKHFSQISQAIHLNIGKYESVLNYIIAKNI